MFEAQETAALPDPVTLPGLIAVHRTPIGIVSLRLTIPANLFSEVTVIVIVTELPEVVAGGVVAVIV